MMTGGGAERRVAYSAAPLPPKITRPTAAKAQRVRASCIVCSSLTDGFSEKGGSLPHLWGRWMKDFRRAQRAKPVLFG